MADDSDYIVYQPPAPTVNAARSVSESGGAPVGLSEGLWQQETLGVLEMYSDKAKFSKP